MLFGCSSGSRWEDAASRAADAMVACLMTLLWLLLQVVELMAALPRTYMQGLSSQLLQFRVCSK